jgi:restriction system protein
MAKKTYKTSIFDTLLQLPWWLHLMLASGSLFLPFFINPWLSSSSNQLAVMLTHETPYLGILISGLFFVLTLICGIKQWWRKRIFSKQHQLSDLYQLSWEQFEYLVREVFIKSGYRVKARGGAQADGGVDLEVYGNDKKIIVQCKHWKKNQVGVSVVREMLGVAVHERAHEVYIVTCGYFSRPAKDFAEDKPIHLINGYRLIEWINDLKK